ncbi:MAG: hypothetical protein HY665_07220 [Chloroflexi bacterium]|nr:hypothetical protein [Chloroflexota bacterium]
MPKDSGSAPNLVSAESRVRRTTSEKHPKEIELMATVLNIYTTGFNQIGAWERTEKNDIQYARLFLVARSLHSMRSATLLTINGYYAQAMAILRTVTEDWLVGRDCENYQPTLDALLRDKHRFGDKKLRLRYKDMAERIGERDKLECEIYDSDYRFGSRFTHAGRISLAIMRNPSTSQLKVIPEYDQVLFLSCCELMMRNSLLLNELMYRFLEAHSEASLMTWNSTVEESVGQVAAWVIHLRKKYGNVATESSNTELGIVSDA